MLDGLVVEPEEGVQRITASFAVPPKISEDMEG